MVNHISVITSLQFFENVESLNLLARQYD